MILMIRKIKIILSEILWKMIRINRQRDRIKMQTKNEKAKINEEKNLTLEILNQIIKSNMKYLKIHKMISWIKKQLCLILLTEQMIVQNW